MSDWRDVSTALLGRWPATVGTWRAEVLAAFVSELQFALTADDALYAIRAFDGSSQIVPPSVPQLEAVARRDPTRPTPDEMVEQIYGPGGLLGFKRSDAPPIHLLVHAFAQRKGLDWLRELPIHGDNGNLILRDLKRDFEVFVEENEHRDRAALAAGERRGQLGRFDAKAFVEESERRLDPLRALPAARS